MPGADELFESVIEVLGDRALPIDDVRAELVARGVNVGRPDKYGVDAVVRLLHDHDSLADFRDGRIAHIPSALQGVSWTIDVDQRDADRGITLADDGLNPLLGWLMEQNDRGGTTVLDGDGNRLGNASVDGFHVDGADHEVVIWPAESLDALVGRSAAVTIVDSTTLRLAALDDTPLPTDAHVAAIRAAFEATKTSQAVDDVMADGPVDIETSTIVDVLTDMVLIDGDACRAAPIPQLARLLEAADLEQHHQLVGNAGTDWEALDGEFRLRRTELEHRLDREQAKRLVLLAGAATARNDDGTLALGTTDDEVAGALALIAAMLSDAAVAEAAWDHWSERGETGDGLSEITERLRDAFGDETPAGVAWLLSRHAAMYDRTAEAIELLERAKGLDEPEPHAGVLTELAAYEADRSNPLAARRLLIEAGVDTAVDLDEQYDPATSSHGFGPELAEEIAPFAVAKPRPMAGRNDPCPCGSGRKYKHCHLGNELHALDDRAGWLYVKMMRYMAFVAPGIIVSIADGIVDDVLDPALRQMVANSYLPTDLALHEGGIGERFATAKAALLPADELELITAWNQTDRSVYEVVRSTHDTMEVIDLASRQRLTVRDTVPEEPLEPGWKMLGRLLPVGDTVRAYGGFLPVNDDMVEPLLAAFATRQLDMVSIAIGQIFEAAEAHDEMQQMFDDSLDTSELESLIESLSDDD